jgi:hypothetical protein
MTLDEVMEAAKREAPVLCYGINSTDPQEFVWCRRVREVAFVVPQGRGGYWVAVCESANRHVEYRARIENVRPA